MRVRALVSFVSPVASPSVGEELELSAEQAAAWIAAGIVERVGPADVETAIQPAPELAVARRGGRR